MVRFTHYFQSIWWVKNTFGVNIRCNKFVINVITNLLQGENGLRLVKTRLNMILSHTRDPQTRCASNQTSIVTYHSLERHPVWCNNFCNKKLLHSLLQPGRSSPKRPIDPRCKNYQWLDHMAKFNRILLWGWIWARYFFSSIMLVSVLDLKRLAIRWN